MQHACAPIAIPPGGLRVLSFSRRRHIDLQRVTSCLCRSSR
ncbi:putative leader peptide [Actinocrinis sp.]